MNKKQSSRVLVILMLGLLAIQVGCGKKEEPAVSTPTVSTGGNGPVSSQNTPQSGAMSQRQLGPQ
jgi:hypothetical protein